MFLRLLVLIAIIAIFYIGLKLSQGVKRKKERSHTDLDLLKPRKLGVKRHYSLPAKNKDLVKLIVNDLEELNPRIARATEDEALIYFENSGESKFKGMISTPDKKMPVRIIIKQENKELLVQIDEDYGTQMFAKSAKKILREKYENCFNFYIDQIEMSINTYKAIE